MEPNCICSTCNLELPKGKPLCKLCGKKGEEVKEGQEVEGLELTDEVCPSCQRFLSKKEENTCAYCGEAGLLPSGFV